MMHNLGDIAGLTPSDGSFIVGDGTNFVTETGNTARTSLGLGTSDSPSFLGLTVSGLTANQYVRTTTGGQLTSSATVPWSDVSSQPTILSSLDGVSNDEAGIDLVAGGTVTITPDDSANTITISAADQYTGTVTNIATGSVD
jgi:hypothetical protein